MCVSIFLSCVCVNISVSTTHLSWPGVRPRYHIPCASPGETRSPEVVISSYEHHDIFEDLKLVSDLAEGVEELCHHGADVPRAGVGHQGHQATLQGVGGLGLGLATRNVNITIITHKKI